MAIWLGFSLITVGLWGLWAFFSKMATQHLPPAAVYLVSGVGHLVIIGYLGLTGGWVIPWQPVGLVTAVAAGLCTALGVLCFFKALAGGASTLVVPLTALYPVVTVVLSRLFLQESLTPRHLAGIALALVAGWLLSE